MLSLADSPNVISIRPASGLQCSCAGDAWHGIHPRMAGHLHRKPAGGHVLNNHRALLQLAAATCVFRFRGGRRKSKVPALGQKEEIPAVDLDGCSWLSAGDGAEPPAEIVAAVRAALMSHGLFSATGHGVPSVVVKKVRAESLAFFDEPLEVKQSCAVYNMERNRGYEIYPHHQRFLEQWQATSVPPDAHAEPSAGQGIVCERFCCGPPAICEADEPRAKSTEWKLDDYYRSAYGGLGLHQCRNALFLGVQLSIFAASVLATTGLATLSEYQLRAKAHQDFGAFTVLARSPGTDSGRAKCGQSGALEARLPSGSWACVPAREDALTVMPGTLIEYLTAGRCRGVMHRVSNPRPALAADSRRLSVTFVAKPDYTAAAVPPDSNLADPSTPTLGDLWRVGWQEKQRLMGTMPHGVAVQQFRRHRQELRQRLLLQD
ncbi:tropC [Symbiodinium necroappetens]|uniref:TropC protein n=1 Tax=Symbiodinium necroappetens TaxID=1628268 RepID=A0A812KC86_9DINO|nr:tropC [Symbiodinium necroappetens]